VNLGLLYGYTRSGGKSGLGGVGDVYGPLGVKAHILLALAPDDMRLKVYKAYLSRNSVALQSARVPWFTPSHLGGLGLPILDKFSPSDLDLRVARKIHAHPDLFQVPVPPTESTYLTWKVAKKALRRFPIASMAVRSLEGLKGGSVQDLTSLLCIEALFRVSSGQINPALHFKELISFGDDEAREMVKAQFGNAGLKAMRDAVKEKGDDFFLDVFGFTVKQLQTVHLNNLRQLNKDVLKDKSVPLPEPFRVGAFPARALNTDNLEGAYTLAVDLPFGSRSSFPLD